jgi:hypothetical protein
MPRHAPNAKPGFIWQEYCRGQSEFWRQIAFFPHTAETFNSRVELEGVVTTIASDAEKDDDDGCASKSWS